MNDTLNPRRLPIPALTVLATTPLLAILLHVMVPVSRILYDSSLESFVFNLLTVGVVQILMVALYHLVVTRRWMRSLPVQLLVGVAMYAVLFLVVMFPLLAQRFAPGRSIWDLVTLLGGVVYYSKADRILVSLLGVVPGILTVGAYHLFAILEARSVLRKDGELESPPSDIP